MERLLKGVGLKCRQPFQCSWVRRCKPAPYWVPLGDLQVQRLVQPLVESLPCTRCNCSIRQRPQPLQPPNNKFNTALRHGSGNDYVTALESRQQLSEDFMVPMVTSNPAVHQADYASALTAFLLRKLKRFINLAAANKALAVIRKELKGILLAFTGQVFSKGKVQAEELRGQIGERLPGAFALFAKSVGKTPAELDKALENGEVTVEDFVTFTKSLFEQYGDERQDYRVMP